MAVATKIFWALGYNQVESFLTTFDPKHVGRSTRRRRCAGPSGASARRSRRTTSTPSSSASREAPDGTYRVIAGRLMPGKILGDFRYDGTRPDDPNDLVPHEHRRELRALRVFGAWTNLTDLKAANTLDTLLTENGRTVVKHYLQDVGSTFGMCNDLARMGPQLGALLSGRHHAGAAVLVRLRAEPVADGATTSSTRRSASSRAIVFDPRTWRPQTPTTAYMEMRDDDAFWAARRVAAFTDELIRAAVHTGQFSDPAAEKYLGDVLIKRRDKITEHLPDRGESRSSRRGSMRRPADVRERGGRGRRRQRRRPPTAPSWSLFDNATGETQPLAETAERDDDASTRRRGLPDRARQLRRGGHLGRERRAPDVAAADPHPLPPRGRRLDARRARTAARGHGGGRSGQERVAVGANRSPSRAHLPARVFYRSGRAGILATARNTPPRTGVGTSANLERPWLPTTVQPLAMPTAEPNTTSLRKCRLSTRRDAAT